MSALTDEEIDQCADSDSMRNVLGGIYHTSVYDFARAVIAANNAKVLKGLKPESLIFPEYHSEAMGCGLEDRGIRDRYEAMQHGWDCAIERCQEVVPDDWYPSDQVAALVKERDALRERIVELEVANESGDYSPI